MRPRPRYRSGYLPTPVPVFYEEFIPDAADSPIMILVHGGALTGACYTTTVDGRPGWAPRFAGHGAHVIVVDWPGIGRSGWCDPDRLGGEDICAALGALINTCPRPVILLTHSMSGPFGFRLAATLPTRIAALVAVAPGPPGDVQPEPRIIRETAELVEVQVGTLRWAIPKHGIVQPEAPLLERKMIGASSRFPPAARDISRRIFSPIPSRLLWQRQNVRGSQLRVGNPSGYRNKPILVITGSADTDHPRAADEAVVAWLSSLGAAVTFRFLDDEGMSGNGHLLMMEDNSDAIADEITAWLKQRTLW